MLIRMRKYVIQRKLFLRHSLLPERAIGVRGCSTRFGELEYQLHMGENRVTPSRDLINAFKKEGDEVRFKESVVYYDCSWSNYYPSDNYPFMYKCRSANSSIIKYRYADVLLLKAEALIMQDTPDLEAAAGIIDEIRKRAGLGKLPSSIRENKNSMIDALLKERRLELAF